MAGIYLHIPFCKQACHYCDFHFSTSRSGIAEMADAISQELLLQKDYLMREPVSSIYFGGGTPSILESRQLTQLLNAISQNYHVNSNAEITLEANPDDFNKEKLTTLKAAGINRLSIGIQSLNDALLRYLNRPHNASAAIQCIELAQDVGFENISVDLIYAIPGQDERTWRDTIRQTLYLRPQHISAYSLTIEPRTVFGNWHSKGKLTPVNDDQAAHYMEILFDQLTAAGFEHYEVSNFALPGFYSKHNTSYWQQKKYLGVGPSAHSYNGASRQFNVRNNSFYVQSLKKGTVPFEQEILSREDHVNEYLLTTLRTMWGTNLSKLKTLYGYDLKEREGSYINSLVANGLAVLSDDILTLTRSGRLLADKVSADLFLEADAF